MNQVQKKQQKISELKNVILELETQVEEFENADDLIKENEEKIIEFQQLLIDQLENKIEVLEDKIVRLKDSNKSISVLLEQQEILANLTELLDVLNKGGKIKDLEEEFDEFSYCSKSKKKNICEPEEKKLSENPELSEVDRALVRIEEEAVEDAKSILDEVKEDISEDDLNASLYSEVDAFEDELDKNSDELVKVDFDVKNDSSDIISDEASSFTNDVFQEEIPSTVNQTDVEEVQPISFEKDTIQIQEDINNQKNNFMPTDNLEDELEDGDELETLDLDELDEINLDDELNEDISANDLDLNEFDDLQNIDDVEFDDSYNEKQISEDIESETEKITNLAKKAKEFEENNEIDKAIDIYKELIDLTEKLEMNDLNEKLKNKLTELS